MIRTVSRSSLPFVLASLALAACNELPKRPGTAVETTSSGKLDKKSPIDVVVAPVENATGRKGVPVAALRASFQKGLVKRRYSPLALEYVDRKVVNAAYAPGALKEESVLQVTIETWDDSLWALRGALTVKARARMLDAVDPSGGPLWVGSVDHRFDLGTEADLLPTQEARTRWVCEKIATEILAALPARNASVGD